MCNYSPLQQARIEEEDKKTVVSMTHDDDTAEASTSEDSKKCKIRIKKSAYFSDEEELSD